VEAALVIATLYLGPIGSPLYCSTPTNPLVYAPQTTPWVALPVEDYVSGKVECGDPVYVRFHLSDGTTRSLMARAYDAGPFSRFCVVQPDGSCPHIGVDVPSYWWPVDDGTISMRAELYPIGQWARECRERGLRD
jgi:hypothetical protein